ncbi:MAG: hypothetical protein JOZ31_06360 [Verrucomicrobia bacterium]|nr:hypothetical protein [Verrucomicrobiota bacterium]MBV8486221.1 hypothetical protein [Verrucomicrobiota bacterium]
MNRIKYIIAAAVLGLFLCATTKAKEEKVIQFTTLPQVVRTTVFHHYNITAPEKVVRVVELSDNIYEVTVLTDSGQQVVYVNAEGNIVERPSGVVETTGETTGGSESGEVTVTLDQVQSAGERYEFVQDQGPDAIFIDHQTNKRVIVKGGAGKARGGVRMKEGSQTNSQTDERTTEKNQTDIRTNEQNKGAARTEERDQQSGNMREKTDQGNADQSQKNMRDEQRNTDQGDKNMRESQKTQNQTPQGEQRDQGNRESAAPNNGQQEKNASQRSTNGEQQGQKQQRETTRTPGEQQNQEKSKGKAKASPTP